MAGDEENTEVWSDGTPEAPAPQPTEPPPPSPVLRKSGPPVWLIVVAVLVLVGLVSAAGLAIGRLTGGPKVAPVAPVAPVASGSPAAPAAAVASVPPDVDGAQAGDPTEENGLPKDQQNNPLWTQCVNENGAAEVTACTAIINANDENAADLAVAYNDRGVGYNDSGQYSLAIADFNRSIQLDPNDTCNALNNLSQTDLAVNDPAGALAAVTACLQVDPIHSDGYATLGDYYAWQQDWPNAIANYTKAIQLLPTRAWAYIGRGQALRATGQTDAAMTDFNAALNIKATDIEALVGQGEVLYDQGKYGMAVDDFTKALTSDPQYDVALFWRSMAELKSGYANDAAQDLAAAHQINPNIGASTLLNN